MTFGWGQQRTLWTVWPLLFDVFQERNVTMARTTCLILTPSPFVLQNLIFIISHFLLDVATPIYFAPLSFTLHPYFTHIHYFLLFSFLKKYIYVCCIFFPLPFHSTGTLISFHHPLYLYSSARLGTWGITRGVFIPQQPVVIITYCYTPLFAVGIIVHMHRSIGEFGHLYTDRHHIGTLANERSVRHQQTS